MVYLQRTLGNKNIITRILNVPIGFFFQMVLSLVQNLSYT